MTAVYAYLPGSFFFGAAHTFFNYYVNNYMFETTLERLRATTTVREDTMKR